MTKLSRKTRDNFVIFRRCLPVRWYFAYDFVVGEYVRRRRDMWSWEKIKIHRQFFHEYKRLWVLNLTSYMLSAQDKDDIEVLSSTADWEFVTSVFKINLKKKIREFCEMFTIRKKIVKIRFIALLVTAKFSNSRNTSSRLHWGNRWWYGMV